MASCDEGFVSSPEPAVCRVETDSTGEVGVVIDGEERLMCFRQQGSSESWHLPVSIVVGIVLLLLVVVLLGALTIIGICWLPNKSHQYEISGKDIDNKCNS